jgi:hypothetical protein
MYKSSSEAAASRSRRRVDGQWSAVQDQPSSIHVEEDIPSRIRSLLASRHTSRPPRTPWSSEEVHHRQFDSFDGTGVDFAVGWNVSEALHFGGDRLEFIGKPLANQPYETAMQSQSGSKRDTFPRRSTSLSDLRRSQDCLESNTPVDVVGDSSVHDTLLSYCPPSSSVRGDKSFTKRWIPSSTHKADHHSPYEMKPLEPTVTKFGFKLRAAFKPTSDAKLQELKSSGLTAREIPGMDELAAVETTASGEPQEGRDLLDNSSSRPGSTRAARSKRSSTVGIFELSAAEPSSAVQERTSSATDRRSSMPSQPMHNISSSAPSEARGPSLNSKTLRNAKRHVLLKPSVAQLFHGETSHPVSPLLSKPLPPMPVAEELRGGVGNAARCDNHGEQLPTIHGVSDQAVVSDGAGDPAKVGQGHLPPLDRILKPNPPESTTTIFNVGVAEYCLLNPGRSLIVSEPVNQPTCDHHEASTAQEPVDDQTSLHDVDLHVYDEILDHSGISEKNEVAAPHAEGADAVEGEDPEKVDHEEQERDWGVVSWIHNLASEASPKYTVVSQQPSPDVPAQKTHNPPIVFPTRKYSVRGFMAKAAQKLESRPAGNRNEADQLLLPERSMDDIALEALKKKSDSELSVKWLRDMISVGNPHIPRLTALPQRTRRVKEPSHDVQSLKATTYEPKPRPSISQAMAPRPSQTFARTIGDLEHLMSEALQIARQAAEQGHPEYIPALFQDAATVLQKGQQRIRREVSLDHGSRVNIRRRLPRAHMSENDQSFASVHESVHSMSTESSCISSCRESSEDCKDFYQHPSEKCEHLPLDRDMTVRRALLEAPNPPILPLDRDFAQGSTNHKTFGKSTMEAFTSVVKKPGKSRREPSLRDGNQELSGPSRPPKDGVLTRQTAPSLGGNVSARAPKVPDRGSSIAHMSTGSEHTSDRNNLPEVKAGHPLKGLLPKRQIGELVRAFNQRPIQNKYSSVALQDLGKKDYGSAAMSSALETRNDVELFSVGSDSGSYEEESSGKQYSDGQEVDFSTPVGFRRHDGFVEASGHRRHGTAQTEGPQDGLPSRSRSHHGVRERVHRLKHELSHLSLSGKSHVSLKGKAHHHFSLSRSHKRQPIARDWSPGRKRFVAAVACISTAMIGIVIGIYAGEVPSIQYYIADLYHYAIMGNVVFYLAIALSTFLFWPLPLLHGRKPYTLTALTIAMPLLFPQAIAVSVQRSPYVATYRVGLIFSRAIMGLVLGFANINFLATLTDLFGASLMSGNPHQERVDEYDVRRHGGGLGVWLGIWTWCYMGSIGFGFWIGAWIINSLSPDWGFYVTIVIIATVLLLNVLTPEVRRSAYRKSVAEVRKDGDISRRFARGEVMMHRIQTGPKWWWEEVRHGLLLSRDMMRQPGFLALSLYVAWMYGQLVLTIVLLGSLMSKYYRFQSPYVGLTTLAIPLGALLAVPFQKASLFSRARHHPQRTDSMTFDKKVTFTSHLIRRAIFTLGLPFASLAYTLSSGGPPTPFILPVLFAGLIGFLSNLAIAECNGIIMETFDTSDLQPGMTGRPRGASGERSQYKRTNYSSFPRISSAFAIIQSLGFLIAAAATGVGGVAERALGAMTATGVMAGILLIKTILFLCVLIRWKDVQLIPSATQTAIDTEQNRQDGLWGDRRDARIAARDAALEANPGQQQPDVEEEWRPIIIGNPSGKFRRMNVLELGAMSRWSEIRRRNRLVHAGSYEDQHPNMATLQDVKQEIKEKTESVRREMSRRSQRSRRSARSTGASASERPTTDSDSLMAEPENGDLGMGTGGSGKDKGKRAATS